MQSDPGVRRGDARRRLLAFGLLTLVLVGLFGMHVLSGSAGHGGHDTRSPAALIATDHEAAGADMGGSVVTAAGVHASSTMAAPDPAPGDAHCPGPCGDPDPGHVMLMVGCVLALLVAVVLLFAPLMLGYSWRSLVLAIRSLPPAGTVLPRPRPPSLRVLSISRT
ncbi:DUF6153 family protein [Aurantimicrobium photophilum]|uniref:Uncharacterized protein n=1 Tax=Aurantimicrobium photophilum TaxID=1987356 RepID=A0A2Z3RZR5_9MICO|nr:DUF6153 family protein [Aurantimicrobium photophilum]AWR21960.1 hypothetical protein AURMO_01370 [Aurantimicrobium photophilum]